jgi:phosphoglycerate-specific signal transduction histidine kinase
MNDISTPDVPTLILAYAGPQERLLKRLRAWRNGMDSEMEDVRQEMKRESEKLLEQSTPSLQRWWKRVVQTPSKIRDSMRDNNWRISVATSFGVGLLVLMFMIALILMWGLYVSALSATPSSTTREHAR